MKQTAQCGRGSHEKSWANLGSSETFKEKRLPPGKTFPYACGHHNPATFNITATHRSTHARRKGPLDLEIRHFSFTFLANKVVFLISKRKNYILPLLPPPGKIFMATSGKIR